MPNAKQLISGILSNPFYVCTGIIAISVFSLASAYTAQYIFGLQPCVLCLYQRAPYFAAALLALIGLIAAPQKPKISAALILICAIAFLCGSVIAAYHTGVELHWWKSFLEGCQVNFNVAEGDDILASIQSQSAVRCDEIPWSDPILKLSMANYNAVLSFIYAAFSLAGSILVTRKSNGF